MIDNDAETLIRPYAHQHHLLSADFSHSDGRSNGAAMAQTATRLSSARRCSSRTGLRICHFTSLVSLSSEKILSAVV